MREEVRQNNVEEPTVRHRRRQLPAAFISQLHRMNPSNLGAMDQICYDCNAKHWIGEKPAAATRKNDYFTSCCKKGEVDIELLR
mgnify:FL=1